MTIFTNAKGETVMPFHIFKEIPIKNILKTIEENRKKIVRNVKNG